MITKRESKCLFCRCRGEEATWRFEETEMGEPGALVLVQNLDAAQDLADVEESLDRLLRDIRDVDIDDLPRDLQSYVFGVPARFRQFLRKLASLVAIYREHRP